MLWFIDFWWINAVMWSLYGDYNRIAVEHICAVWQAYLSSSDASNVEYIDTSTFSHIIDYLLRNSYVCCHMRWYEHSTLCDLWPASVHYTNLGLLSWGHIPQSDTRSFWVGLCTFAQRVPLQHLFDQSAQRQSCNMSELRHQWHVIDETGHWLMYFLILVLGT